MNPRNRLLAYWTSTVLVAFVLISGGAAQAFGQHDTVAGVVRLGYPVYFVTLLGVWKVLGGLAILAPRLPRLKEWAYAGAVFDLTGASISSAVSGLAARHVIVPLVLAALGFSSWALRPAARRLG
ncbi:MAG: DoxX family protein [Deltaproteobacteria bacterium]